MKECPIFQIMGDETVTQKMFKTRMRKRFAEKTGLSERSLFVRKNAIWWIAIRHMISGNDSELCIVDRMIDDVSETFHGKRLVITRKMYEEAILNHTGCIH
jgi:hypothetical protein